MSENLSKRIKVINIICIFLVVQLHSYNLNIEVNNHNDIVYFIQRLISYGICRVAVPILGIIAGFLFFFSKFEYKNKVISRFKSLMIPYCIYKIVITVLVMILLVMTSSLNINNVFFMVDKYTHHLWFIKDLFFIVLISPLIKLILNDYSKHITPIIMFLTIFNKSIYLSSLLTYFIIGALLSKGYKENDKIKYFINKKERSIISTTISFLIWIVISIIYSISDIYILRNLSVIVGIYFIYECSKFIYENKFILDLSRYSFFIYLIHEPLIGAFKKLIISILGNSKVVSIMIYFITPIAIIVLTSTTAKILIRLAPRGYYILSGGRGKEVTKNELK